MTDWEERALLRDREDPQRRATVMDRLKQGLAAQLPFIMGALAGLYAVVAGWHFLGPGSGGTPPFAALFTAAIGAGMVIGACLTWSGNLASTQAHTLLFSVALLATTVSFVHLATTGNALHGIGFALILLASAAFFQDRLRLGVVSAITLAAWVIGMRLGPQPPEVWPPVAFAMLSTVVLLWLTSTFRIRELRRLESLNLELHAQIGFDPLTGIANRRAFNERLQGLWKRLELESGSLALILVDLDHFKNLNDTRGHGEGDGALRQVGGVLRMAVRSTEDLPARLGGEEFAILLPRTRLEHALLVAERVRDAVSFTRIPNPGTPNGNTLTASIGVAMAWPGDGRESRDLMERADAALYRAKNEGRDRVVVDKSEFLASQALEPSFWTEGESGLDPGFDAEAVVASGADSPVSPVAHPGAPPETQAVAGSPPVFRSSSSLAVRGPGFAPEPDS
ncbi:hypothetical protein BH23GEM11_BH23GEM11_11250 [soil metagenome]